MGYSGEIVFFSIAIVDLSVSIQELDFTDGYFLKHLVKAVVSGQLGNSTPKNRNPEKLRSRLACPQSCPVNSVSTAGVKPKKFNLVHVILLFYTGVLPGKFASLPHPSV